MGAPKCSYPYSDRINAKQIRKYHATFNIYPILMYIKRTRMVLAKYCNISMKLHIQITNRVTIFLCIQDFKMSSFCFQYVCIRTSWIRDACARPFCYCLLFVKKAGVFLYCFLIVL